VLKNGSFTVNSTLMPTTLHLYHLLTYKKATFSRLSYSLTLALLSQTVSTIRYFLGLISESTLDLTALVQILALSHYNTLHWNCSVSVIALYLPVLLLTCSTPYLCLELHHFSRRRVTTIKRRRLDLLWHTMKVG